MEIVNNDLTFFRTLTTGVAPILDFSSATMISASYIYSQDGRRSSFLRLHKKTASTTTDSNISSNYNYIKKRNKHYITITITATTTGRRKISASLTRTKVEM